MTRRLILLLTLLLTLPFASRAQVSVSGNLRDVGVQNVTGNNTYVEFTLQNYGSNIPRVVGSTVLVNPVVRFKPNGSGNISGNIQPNSTINPSGTFYRACIVNQGNQFRCANYLITANFDLSTATPLTSIPVAGPNQLVLQTYPCIVSIAATTWNCKHNFNDQLVLINIYDSSNRLIFPDTTDSSDPNTTVITFVTPQAGTALISHAGSIAIATSQPNAVLQNPVGSQTISGGTLAVSSNFTATAGQNSMNLFNLNGYLYVDGIKYPTLASALADCPAVKGCVVYDNLPETFSANPFVSMPATTACDVHFGPGTWTVNSQIAMQPSQFPCTMIGAGRSSGSAGTIFKAGSSFPINTSLIVNRGTQGSRIENLTVDCNSVSGSSGLFASDINEQSGFVHVTVLNCPAYGINVDATTPINIPAQNYTIRDVEILPQAAGTGTTIGLNIKGNGAGCPQELSNVVASGQTSHVIQASVSLNSCSSGNLRAIHGEFTTSVLELNATTVTADTISGELHDTNLVKVATGANTFLLTNLVKNGATNILVDPDRGYTLTDSQISMYHVGPGAIGSEDIYSTSPNVFKTFVGGPVFLGNVQFNNGIFQKETASPGGAGGFDGCYGDSAAHVLKCSNNNDAFSQVTRFVDSGRTYSAAGVVQASPHTVADAGTLSSGTPSSATITLVGSAAFTSSSSYNCIVTNKTTQANPLKIGYTDGSHFVVTGPNTVSDNFSYICLGN